MRHFLCSHRVFFVRFGLEPIFVFPVRCLSFVGFGLCPLSGSGSSQLLCFQPDFRPLSGLGHCYHSFSVLMPCMMLTFTGFVYLTCHGHALWILACSWLNIGVWRTATYPFINWLTQLTHTNPVCTTVSWIGAIPRWGYRVSI
jgi:hypothetical protein